MLWLLLGGIIGAFVDPFRWAIGAASGWFVSNPYLAYVLGITCPLLLSMCLASREQASLSGLTCLTGSLASALIVLIFSKARKNRDVKEQPAPIVEED